jgi:hypothetical protein
METNLRDLAPLSELFLLLPEHRRIIQGETKQVGRDNESARVRRVTTFIAIALAILVIYIVFVISLMILGQQVQPFDIVAIASEIALAAFMGRLLFLLIRRLQCNQKLEVIGILLPGSVIEAKTDKGISLKGIKDVLRLHYEFTSLKVNALSAKKLNSVII